LSIENCLDKKLTIVKTPARAIFGLIALLLTCLGGALPAANLSEDFDNVPALFGSGWILFNNSTFPGALDWFQGNNFTFGPHQTTGYLASTSEATNGAFEGDISLWLLTPSLTFSNGDQISFFTRTVTGSTRPDRLELRFSDQGASIDVGTGPFGVGDFTRLLLSVNPALTVGGYPEDWTEFSATISGLAGPTDGRIAFRYFVTDGGGSGANSNYIGVDTLRIVPEPSALMLFGVGGFLAALILRRRRR
jgi:hypothetical protein